MLHGIFCRRSVWSAYSIWSHINMENKFTSNFLSLSESIKEIFQNSHSLLILDVPTIIKESKERLNDFQIFIDASLITRLLPPEKLLTATLVIVYDLIKQQHIVKNPEISSFSMEKLIKLRTNVKNRRRAPFNCGC